MYRNDTTAPKNRQTDLDPKPENGGVRGTLMADKIVLKIFASATNPGEVGRRKAIVAQAAKSFGALRVDTKEDFSSLTLLVAFDDREKATAFQEDCNKQPLLRVLEGVPNGARRFN
jgi:hypothetical protein